MEFEVGEYVLLRNGKVLKVFEISHRNNEKVYSCISLSNVDGITYLYQDWIDGKYEYECDDEEQDYRLNHLRKPMAHSFNLQYLDFTDKEER